jgi:hypothetical protein
MARLVQEIALDLTTAAVMIMCDSGGLRFAIQWLMAAEHRGDFIYYHTRAVLTGTGLTDEFQFVFTDPDTAFAFRMRWA